MRRNPAFLFIGNFFEEFRAALNATPRFLETGLCTAFNATAEHRRWKFPCTWLSPTFAMKARWLLTIKIVVAVVPSFQAGFLWSFQWTDGVFWSSHTFSTSTYCLIHLDRNVVSSTLNVVVKDVERAESMSAEVAPKTQEGKETINQSINRTMDTSNNQTINQSINHSIKHRRAKKQRTPTCECSKKRIQKGVGHKIGRTSARMSVEHSVERGRRSGQFPVNSLESQRIQQGDHTN